MDLISNEVFVKDIFPFLGKGHYRYLASVSKSWRDNYEASSSADNKNMNGSNIAKNTTYKAAVSSIECAKIWCSDNEHFVKKLGKKRINGSDHEVWLCYHAARHGKLNVLRWALIEQSLPLRDNAWKIAIQYGHLDCLRFIHDYKRKGERNGENSSFCILAASNGQIDCLRYVHMSIGSSIIDTRIAIAAAKNGHLNCLQYAFENGCTLNYEVCYRAASNGHIDCLKYARNVASCDWDSMSCRMAARGGHYNCLVYLHTNGCELGRSGADAVQCDHVDCLRYSHENGFPLSSILFWKSAYHASFRCMQYLYDVRCPWDARTCEATTYRNNLHILQWLRSRQCPWDTKTYTSAVNRGHGEMAQWALDNGCPATVT